MTPLLFGVVLGALLPIACSVVERFVHRRRQRRRAMNHLRRTIPVLSDR